MAPGPVLEYRASEKPPILHPSFTHTPTLNMILGSVQLVRPHDEAPSPPLVRTVQRQILNNR